MLLFGLLKYPILQVCSMLIYEINSLRYITGRQFASFKEVDHLPSRRKRSKKSKSKKSKGMIQEIFRINTYPTFYGLQSVNLQTVNMTNKGF